MYDTPRCEGDKGFQVDVGDCHIHYGGEGKNADLGGEEGTGRCSWAEASASCRSTFLLSFTSGGSFCHGLESQAISYSARVQDGAKTELTPFITLRASHPLSQDVLYVSVRQSSGGTV